MGRGGIIVVIKGDARSLDYGSYDFPQGISGVESKGASHEAIFTSRHRVASAIFASIGLAFMILSYHSPAVTNVHSPGNKSPLSRWLWVILGSYYNIPKATFYLLRW